MKTIFTTAIIIAIVVFFTAPGKTLAANDTLVVFANGASLDQIINSDTTSSGMQVHKAYKLVSLDTTYLYLAPVTVKSNLTVIGVPGSNGRPPCIQPGVLPDGSLSAVLFNLNGQGTIGIFKNLYICDLSIISTYTLCKNFLISADNIKLYLDNVISEENHYEVIAFTGQKDDFFVTNCKFRNGVDPTNWFGATLLTCDYPTNNPADSIVMKYNTFLCVNSRAASTGNDGYVKYFEFSHNSYIYNFTEDLRMFTVTTGKFDDNIFYSLYAGAMPVKETPAWFEVFSPEYNSLIDFDTLTIAMDSVFDPTNYGNSNARMLAEAKRNIEAKNNVYFWPTKLKDFWNTWNNNHSGSLDPDSLITASFMNNRTTNMFNDKTHWPNLVASGNQNVDPGFGSGILNVLDQGGATGIESLLDYISAVRGGTAATDVWAYKPQTVSGTNWIPQWPLPEVTDMQYSNTALQTGATDGKPIGDPFWFTGQPSAVNDKSLVANSFSLSEAYPNPFNPSTSIKFSLAKSGNVSLKVYNVMGQLVKTIVNNEYKNQGESTYHISMDNMTSGIYFYTLIQGNQTITKKMVLLK